MIKDKKAALHNLGCKVNSYELDAMKELLEKDGFSIVPFEEVADVYIVNTCTVTNIADRKSRQMLHKARKNNPDAVIVAVGCYVNSHAKEILQDESIDLCIGNNQKGKIASIVLDYLKNKTMDEKEEQSAIPDINQEKNYEDMSIASVEERCRAFIKIQDGCNQFCSYCIIPFSRGRARSRDKESILKEINGLAKKGYQEFVITGIHLSSYGTDFKQEKPQADQFGGEYLLDVLEEISRIEGVKRIRLGSLEPRLVTREFAEKLAGIPKICPHFHLSLQSGCNRTLKNMNRHYTAEDFKERTAILREMFEHPAITTDIIVGFPGETEEDFEECRKFAEDISFFEMHIFKYSRRKGTVADRMPNQHTDAKKSERSDVLEALEQRQSKEFRSYYIGKICKVLFEEKKAVGGQEYWVGHTPEYVMVAIPAEKQGKEDLVNRICSVQAEDFLTSEFLLGQIVDETCN